MQKNELEINYFSLSFSYLSLISIFSLSLFSIEFILTRAYLVWNLFSSLFILNVWLDRKADLWSNLARAKSKWSELKVTHNSFFLLVKFSIVRIKCNFFKWDKLKASLFRRFWREKVLLCVNLVQSQYWCDDKSVRQNNWPKFSLQNKVSYQIVRVNHGNCEGALAHIKC